VPTPEFSQMCSVFVSREIGEFVVSATGGAGEVHSV